jgi:hypothetical protein
VDCTGAESVGVLDVLIVLGVVNVVDAMDVLIVLDVVGVVVERCGRNRVYKVIKFIKL